MLSAVAALLLRLGDEQTHAGCGVSCQQMIAHWEQGEKDEEVREDAKEEVQRGQEGQTVEAGEENQRGRVTEREMVRERVLLMLEAVVGNLNFPNQEA